MPSRLIISVISFLICTCVFSQAQDTSKVVNDYKKRAYIGVGYGYSISMGSFSYKNRDDLNSAFAKNGQSIHLFDFGYRINDAFSVKAFYLNATNSIESKELARNLSRASNNRYSVTTSEYELKALLLGVGVTKPSNSIDLELSFLLGYGTTFIPSFLFTETDLTTNTQREINFEANDEAGIGVGLSTGLRIHLSKDISFNTTASYIIFEKEFEQLRIEDNIVSKSPSKTSYEILNINFGLAYRFINE